MPEDTDHELISRALQGNQKAFRKIVEGYQSVAYAVVRAILGDRDDVEDVLQNVFIKVYKGLHSFRGDAKLSTWIYRIARNEAINAVAKSGKNLQPLEDMELAAPEEDGPEARLGKRELRGQMDIALSRLDEAQRVAIELRYMSERSYHEIAEIMG
ncbi:MAG: sigma-70 family RNA polymerase sigma factor, partial [Candidatus Latescibacterota bacterium]